MTHTLFVSDLHLSHERPHTTRLFLAFLQQQAQHAQALYILGDLFEYWAGDDDLDDAHHRPVIEAMRKLTRSGCKLYFMHGNRDFLIGGDFAHATGAELLADPWRIELCGQTAVLTHGDLLCTDDTDYQNFRVQVRDPLWQQKFLSLPLAERKAQITQLRARSEQEKSYKTAAIMDVAPQAVVELLRQYDYPALLIHGHTHRPAHHRIVLDGRICERIVLPEWGLRGGYLRCAADGWEMREVVS
ncbi:MAG: UDP-2,3-diacylglucosamine diphosphatase [Methylophilaceae bacterium]|nr:UDP-2,3-diacylglucosamine diphosphatase [Methylophilaceae bacterium]